MTIQLPLGPVMADVAGLTLTDDDIKEMARAQGLEEDEVRKVLRGKGLKLPEKLN